MLRDHRSHATGATQPRGHDGQVKQGEQEVLHPRDRVGQTSGATQRCLILESARELGIRDAQPQRKRLLWLFYFALVSTLGLAARSCAEQSLDDADRAAVDER